MNYEWLGDGKKEEDNAGSPWFLAPESLMPTTSSGLGGLIGLNGSNGIDSKWLDIISNPTTQTEATTANPTSTQAKNTVKWLTNSKPSTSAGSTTAGGKVKWFNPGSTTTSTTPTPGTNTTNDQPIDWGSFGSGGGQDGSDANPGGFSSLGIGEGLATFGPNALGIASFGVPAAIGLGYGIANNTPSLGFKNAAKGIAKSIGLIDKDPTDFGFMEALDPAHIDTNNALSFDGSLGADVTGPSTPSFGADFDSDTSGMFDGSASSFGGMFGDPSAPAGSVNGMSVGGLGTFGGVQSGLGDIDGSIGSMDGPGGSGGGGSNGSASDPDGNGSSGTGEGGHGEGNGGHHAQGGLIKGPGTGTSDSIKAYVSNGEFIMPAKETDKFLPLLEYMRQHGELPPMRGL